MEGHTPFVVLWGFVLVWLQRKQHYCYKGCKKYPKIIIKYMVQISASKRYVGTLKKNHCEPIAPNQMQHWTLIHDWVATILFLVSTHTYTKMDFSCL